MAIPKISKGVWIAVGIALVLGVVLIGYKSCNLGDENAELKGEMNAYKQVAAKNTEAAKKTIAEQTKVIGDMTKKIAVHEAEVSKKNEQIGSLNKTVANLESQYADLKTDAERVVNLKNQVNIWRDKFSLSEGIIKDKDGIIFSLTEKYDAQVKITSAIDTQLYDCRKLQTLYDDRIIVLERSLKQARFVSKLKSWGGVALAAGIVYVVVKK
jgi:chromosome segregation ATPase